MLFRMFEIDGKLVKNQRLTALLFWPKIFNVISLKKHSSHCKTELYEVKFDILSLFRKIVKNQRLTPLVFSHIFRPEIFNVISMKNHSSHCKTKFYAINFHSLNLLLKFEIGQKPKVNMFISWHV